MKSSLKFYLAATTLLAGTATVSAQGFGNAYFLGDSLSDCCQLGRFTQSNTPNYTDVLPGLIGASYRATAQANYAVGGAQSGLYNVASVVDRIVPNGPTGLLSQINKINASGLTFGSRDIAGIWIGTNDIQSAGLTAAEAARVGYIQPLGPRPDTSALLNYTTSNIRTAINDLAARGLRNVVLVSPADLTETVNVRFNSPTSAAIEGGYSAAMRTALANLYTPGINTYFLDAYSLVKKVQANPSQYGFVSASATNNCQANNCSALTLAQQEQYVYNDAIHYTSGFQRILAQYAANIINSRDGLSAQGDLGQAAGQAFSTTLLNRLDAYRQVNTPLVVPGTYTADLPGRPAALTPIPILVGNPVSLFAEGMYAGIDRNSRITPNGPSNPAIGADFTGVTAGIEYRVTPNFLVGAAFNYINTSVSARGLSRTSYDFDSYQGGIFASYNTANFFVDGAITYGSNNYRLTRPGVFDTITAAPDGNTLTAAAKIGYLFDATTFRIGPIAELAYANVRLGSYSERGDNLLTLGVQSQNLDGLTGGAGVQIRTVLPFFGGVLSPFVNLTAQHDFLDGVRTITSFSTNAPALLINTSAGRRGDDVYGKVAGGFTIDLGNGLNGVVSGSSTFGRAYGDDYTVSGGLRYRF